MLDWDSFRVILVVSREGSLVRAGKSLGVTHGTVGRQLQRAEEELGAKLFDRLNNGLFPTDAGKTAIAVAERMAREVETADLQLRGADEAMSGHIRLSVPVNVVPYGLSKDLVAFQETYPEVYLHVNASDEPVDFLNREVDVVMRANNNPSSGLWGFRLTDLTFSFYVSKAFWAQWGEQIEKSPDTVPLPYIAMNDTEPWRDRDQLLHKFPKAEAVAETNGMDTVLPMVRDNVGAGRLGRYVADGYEDLVRIVDCSPECNRTLWILTHPDFRNTPKIRTFMEFVNARFSARHPQNNKP